MNSRKKNVPKYPFDDASFATFGGSGGCFSGNFATTTFDFGASFGGSRITFSGGVFDICSDFCDFCKDDCFGASRAVV